MRIGNFLIYPNFFADEIEDQVHFIVIILLLSLKGGRRVKNLSNIINGQNKLMNFSFKVLVLDLKLHENWHSFAFFF